MTNGLSLRPLKQQLQQTMTMNLREYAAHVFAHAEKLQSYLDSQGEKLGFEADARPSGQFPRDLQESRIALMSVCLDIYDLLDGAESMMTMLPFFAVHDIGALKMLYHYKLWKLVPDQGTVSFDDMSKSLNIEVHRLASFMRYLITRRIFCEPEPNRIAHSTASRLVARNESLQCWIGACTDDILEAVQAYPETYDAHGLSLDPKLSPYNIARKDRSVGAMVLVLSDKERGPRYSKGLGWLAKSEGGCSDSILENYPWDQFGLVVDVGGGDGNFSCSLAKRYPNIRCIIQDIAAQASYFKAPEDIANRLEYQVHDIFTPQPVQADLYVLRIVLHVFGDDEKAAAILRNILPAMKDKSRIVLLDMSVDLKAPVASARVQSTGNVQMHSLCGKDRTAEQWAYVIRLASPELELGKIVSWPDKWWSIIEIVRRESES